MDRPKTAEGKQAPELLKGLNKTREGNVASLSLV
jgi:hypothetical protein